MLTDAGKARCLTGLKGGTTSSSIYGSIHSAKSTTGGNETSTAGGIYSRQLVNFNAPSSGIMTLASSVDWNLPTGAVSACLGLWDHATSTSTANFLGMIALGGTPQEYQLNGTDSYIQAPSNAVANDDIIIFFATTAGGGNISSSTTYRVWNREANRFQIATGTGGSGVVTFSDLTQYASSDAYFVKMLADTYASGGIFRLNALEVALNW